MVVGSADDGVVGGLVDVPSAAVAAPRCRLAHQFGTAVAVEIVDEKQRHREKENPEIERSEPHHLIRRIHQLQKNRSDHLAEHTDDQSADRSECDTRVHRLIDFLSLSASDQTRDRDRAPEGKTGEQADQKIDQRRVAPHRRHRGRAVEPPDHREIRGIEQLLQNTGRRDRNREPKNLSGERPVQHIYFSFFTHGLRHLRVFFSSYPDWTRRQAPCPS